MPDIPGEPIFNKHATRLEEKMTSKIKVGFAAMTVSPLPFRHAEAQGGCATAQN
jgi:hypothetical protein